MPRPGAIPPRATQLRNHADTAKKGTKMPVQNLPKPIRPAWDQKRIDQWTDRPMLVRVIDYWPDHTNQRTGKTNPVVIVDFVDLMGPTDDFEHPKVYVGSMWGAVQVVEKLSEFAGSGDDVLCIAKKVESRQGNPYIALLELPEDSTAYQLGIAWDEQNPSALADARTKKIEEAEAERQKAVGKTGLKLKRPGDPKPEAKGGTATEDASPWSGEVTTEAQDKAAEAALAKLKGRKVPAA